MGSDYYFRMGSKHTICQDYCLAGEQKGVQYAFLSDGCSGEPDPKRPGSPYTDFGSRFLVRSALGQLAPLADGIFPGDRIATEAAGMVRQAGLPPQALDATLLAAIQQGEYLRVFQKGDGVVATRSYTGEIRYQTVQYGGNMPYYLRYTLDAREEDNYLRHAKTVTYTSRVFTPGQGWGPEHTSEEDLLDPQNRIQRDRVYSVKNVELLLIMSDGAQSFLHKSTGAVIPLEEVLEQLFAIKNFEGVFLTRRCNRFLNEFCTKHGWHHTDDLSVAGIYTGGLP